MFQNLSDSYFDSPEVVRNRVIQAGPRIIAPAAYSVLQRGCKLKPVSINEREQQRGTGEDTRGTGCSQKAGYSPIDTVANDYQPSRIARRTTRMAE